MNKNIEITIVTLKSPCSACLIIEGIVKETVIKLKKEMDYLDLNYIVLNDLKGIHDIDGIEVEKFPAVIVEGEQITAGSIPDKKELAKYIQSVRRDSDE